MTNLSYGPFINSRKGAKEAGEKLYYTGKECPHGHVALRSLSQGCTDCKKMYSQRKDAARKQKIENDPEYAARRQETRIKTNANYRANHPDRVRDSNRRWEQKPEVRVKRYAATNKRMRTPEGNAYHANWKRNKKRTDPDFAFACSTRKRIANALVYAKGHKAGTIEELMGCDLINARLHVESQFEEGMSWGNYGLKTWHIDHIRPVASFADLSDAAQQFVCFNWRNHQPMKAFKNLSKNDKWTPAMEAEWAQMMREAGYQGELFLVFSDEVLSA